MKKVKVSFILGLIVVLLVVVATFNVIKKNDTESKYMSAKSKIEQLEKENDSLQSLDDEKEDNTFEDDISWFVTKVYTLENRRKLYEEIEESATKDVLKDLFGDELPPDENQGEVHSMDRDVDNMEIYGKYKDESHYKAIVTFDLSMSKEDNTDNAFTILQVDLTKSDDAWLIDRFEEYAKGGRN